MSQRGPRVEATGVTPSRSKQKPAAPRENGGVAKRLGFKRERALVELPKKIDALHAEMAAIHAAMADPTLYGRDPKGFAAKSARLTAAQAELEAAETEWLELELLREELGS